MFVTIWNRLASESEVVIVSNLQKIGHQVVRLNDQIFDHCIHHRIGIFNPGNRNIANILENLRENNLCYILNQLLLEDRLSILIISKVVEQLLYSISEAFIIDVSSELFAYKLELIRDTVGMLAIAITEQKVALVV